MDAGTRSRLALALGAYALLLTLATVTLTGKIRIAVWIFLGGMTVKTWLSSLRRP